MKSLAEKLTEFNDEAQYSSYTIAHYTNERGDQVSPTYWYGLISGKKQNPTRRRIAALADLFQVPQRYLADDGVGTKVGAVLAETETLSLEEVQQLVTQLQARIEKETHDQGDQTGSE